jgi:hypothetical protein
LFASAIGARIFFLIKSPISEFPFSLMISGKLARSAGGFAIQTILRSELKELLSPTPQDNWYH